VPAPIDPLTAANVSLATAGTDVDVMFTFD